MYPLANQAMHRTHLQEAERRFREIAEAYEAILPAQDFSDASAF